MTYTQKTGSIAARAVQQLADGPMQAADLSAALGIKRANLNGNIATAINAGLLVVDRIDGRAWIRLGAAASPKIKSAKQIVMRYEPPESAPTTPPAPPQFMAARWDDGCLDVYPTLVIDGGFRLNAAQVERLRCLLSGVPE